MIPHVKTYTFKAYRVEWSAAAGAFKRIDVTGRILAPTRTLARLNVLAYGYGGICIGGVTKQPPTH